MNVACIFLIEKKKYLVLSMGLFSCFFVAYKWQVAVTASYIHKMNQFPCTFSVSMHFIKHREKDIVILDSHIFMLVALKWGIFHIYIATWIYERKKTFLHFNLNCVVVRYKVSSQFRSFIHTPSQFLLAFGDLQVLILDSVQNIVQKQ